LEERCQRCPLGTSCDEDGASTTEALDLDKNYWRISSRSAIVHKCPLPEACKGGLDFFDGGDSYCNTGYYGPMCTLCIREEFYLEPSSRTCIPCGDGGGIKQLFTPIPILMACMLVAFFASLSCLVCGSRAKAKASAKRKDSEVSQSIRILHTVRKCAAFVKKEVKKAQIKSKALYAFMQIATNIGFNCNVTFPVEFEISVKLVSIVNLDVLPAFGLQCWMARFDYIDSMVSMTVLPLFMAAFLMLVYGALLAGHTKEAQEADNRRERYVVPQALTGEFSSWTIEAYRQVFGRFDADASGSIDRKEMASLLSEVGEDASVENVDLILIMADSEQSRTVDFGEFLGLMVEVANSRQSSANVSEVFEKLKEKALGQQSHKAARQTISYLFLLLSYLVLVTASTSLFHFWKCHSFPEAEDGTEAYLYKDYSVDCNGKRWENHIPFVVLMTLIYPIGIPATYGFLLWKHRRTLSSATSIHREEAEGFPTIGHILFLTDAYHTEYFWFEVLECVRRLLLASAVGMVAADSAAAPTLGLLIALAFVYVFDHFMPYKSRENSTLGVVLAYSTALLFLGALLIKTTAENDDASDQRVFGFLCTATLFSGPLMILHLVVRRKVCGPKAATEEQLLEAAEKEQEKAAQVLQAADNKLAAAKAKVEAAKEEEKPGASTVLSGRVELRGTSLDRSGQSQSSTIQGAMSTDSCVATTAGGSPPSRTRAARRSLKQAGGKSATPTPKVVVENL